MTKEETIEKGKSSFPKFTVYVCYRNGETTARTGDYYADRGKDYKTCTQALEKSNGEFKERQDEDLYNILRKQELREEEGYYESDITSILDRLRDISNEIDNLINDYED